MSPLNKKQIGKAVTTLVDKYFNKHNELINSGLTSFNLFFKKEHIYPVPEIVFDEFYSFEIEINKRYASLGSYFSKKLEKMEKEALELFETTGKHFDKEYPEYIKFVRKSSFENEEFNTNYRESLIAALHQEREEEFKRKELVCYQKYNKSLRKQYKKLAIDVLLNYIPNIGFTFNKNKGGKDYIICEKEINENYSQFLSLSLKYLKSNESDLSTKKHQFLFQFGVTHNDEPLELIVNNNPQIAVWHLSNFFPINLFPYWDVYGSFDLDKEFEFLVIAHIEMLKIIQSDFEANVYKLI